MNLRHTIVALASAGLIAGCQTASRFDESTSGASPSLVVLVAIDQLRADMIDRYESVFSGGFRRLLDEGHRFSNATHDHAGTYTAPGHTTLSTGVHPSRHGVVGNSWSELRDSTWTLIYSMGDTESAILGFPEMEGRSPANLYRGGLPDWVLTEHPEARVVSISRKDRAAIGLAARAVGEVYWLSETTGRFITSEFYHSEYPEWVFRFHETEMSRIYSDMVWESTIPAEHLGLTRPDTSSYELDGVHTSFPHRAADRSDLGDPGEVNRWRYQETPFPDAAVLALVKTAIRELELGGSNSVDYLGVSFSQTDLIGHRFGPFSREQLDNLIRLDGLLGELFDSLDREVGRGRWVLALSSDHGVLEIPEHLAEEGADAVRFGRDERVAVRDAVNEAAQRGLEGDALANAVRGTVSALPFIAAAYTFREAAGTNAQADSFAALFARSQSEGRVLDFSGRFGVHVRYPPHTLTSAERATHGSPYYYDRSVPLFFIGAGVRPGDSSVPVGTVDVAPTLAALGRIRTPADLDGRSLMSELLAPE
jgi:predicted AlkP superfamily pyrophosphatase or phosphodiesterase